jgi:hypothetical protein
MQCPKCGATLAPNTKFCGTCGTNIEEARAATDTASVSAPPARPKTRNLKLLIIAVVAVAIVVIGIGGISALASSSYLKAEANFFASLANGLPVGQDKGYKSSFSVDYAPEGEIAEEISDIALSGSISQLGQNASAELDFSYDGDVITNLIAAFDGTGVAVQLPEFSDYWLKLVMSDENSDIDFSQLDQKKLEKSVSNVLKSYFKLVEKVSEVEKGVELSGGDVTVKCDEYVIEFNEQLVLTLAQTCIDELQANKNLMDFIDSYGESSAGSYWDGIDEYLDDAEEEITDALDELDGDEGERLFRMTVWIKGKDVIARSIDKVSGGDFEFSYKTLKNSKNAYIEFKGEMEYEGSFALTGSFEKSGGGWSGTPKLTLKSDYGEETITLKAKCEELNISDGKVTGSIKFSGDAPYELFYESFAYDFTIKLDKKGNQQVVILSGEIEEGGVDYDLGELTIAYGVEENSKLSIDMPDENDCVIIDDYSEENEERSWEMQEQLEAAYDELDGNDVAQAIIEVIYDMLP